MVFVCKERNVCGTCVFETHNVGKTFENEKWHGLFVFLGHARTVNSRRPVFVASATFINFWKLLQQANLICLVNDSNSGGSWFKSRRASPPKQLKRKRKEIVYAAMLSSSEERKKNRRKNTVSLHHQSSPVSKAKHSGLLSLRCVRRDDFGCSVSRLARSSPL